MATFTDIYIYIYIYKIWSRAYRFTLQFESNSSNQAAKAIDDQKIGGLRGDIEAILVEAVHGFSGHFPRATRKH